MNYLEIKKIREELGLTQTKLAELVGVNIRTVQKWESNDTKIRKTSELLLKEIYERRKKGVEENVHIPKNNIKHIKLPNGQYIMKVQLIPFEAHALYISEFQDAEYFETFDEVTFVVDKIGLGNYKAFKIKGDSMNGGKINDTEDGAVVLGRELQNHHWNDGFRDSKYGWIVITHHNILFKDIIDYDNKKGEIICHSRNDSPEYSDFPLKTKEIHQIFKVIKRTF
ncbi:Aca2/YdiL-like domain-containing protein [Aquimarina muelleri]|uniref:Aca2/YdiL-like domain-containing protein n=1 Tax=Aquimarina muelleri TaxID=279356 RepID=UPI003F6869D0